MTQVYGITPGYANTLLGLLNTGTVCLQMHNGDPGPLGTANVSTAIPDRVQITFVTPSSGQILITGAPSVTVTSEDEIVAGSLWNGFAGDDSAICMYTLLAQPSIEIAQGDDVNVTGCTLTVAGQAA